MVEGVGEGVEEGVREGWERGWDGRTMGTTSLTNDDMRRLTIKVITDIDNFIQGILR